MDEDISDAELLESLRYRPELEAEAPAKRSKREAKRETEPFVHVTERELLAGLRALDGAHELAVWLYILRERRLRQALSLPESFALTNRALAAWGVNKDSKRRAVRKLAAARLIRVERDGSHSPRVSICGPR